jgi:hypothetical protein
VIGLTLHLKFDHESTVNRTTNRCSAVSSARVFATLQDLTSAAQDCRNVGTDNGNAAEYTDVLHQLAQQSTFLGSSLNLASFPLRSEHLSSLRGNLFGAVHNILINF